MDKDRWTIEDFENMSCMYAPPDSLKEPVRTFEETFSADKVVSEKFFGKSEVTGDSSDYYKLPEGATDLQDLIEHKSMSFALGNIFKACYRFGEKATIDKMYDIDKILWFANRIKKELEKENATR